MPAYRKASSLPPLKRPIRILFSSHPAPADQSGPRKLRRAFLPMLELICRELKSEHPLRPAALWLEVGGHDEMMGNYESIVRWSKSAAVELRIPAEELMLRLRDHNFVPDLESLLRQRFEEAQAGARPSMREHIRHIPPLAPHRYALLDPLLRKEPKRRIVLRWEDATFETQMSGASLQLWENECCDRYRNLGGEPFLEALIHHAASLHRNQLLRDKPFAEKVVRGSRSGRMLHLVPRGSLHMKSLPRALDTLGAKFETRFHGSRDRQLGFTHRLLDAGLETYTLESARIPAIESLFQHEMICALGWKRHSLLKLDFVREVTTILGSEKLEAWFAEIGAKPVADKAAFCEKFGETFAWLFCSSQRLASRYFSLRDLR